MDAVKFIDCLLAEDVSFFTGVPDSYLHGFCSGLKGFSAAQNVIAANEGSAIGVAAGYHFATGKIPLVYLQNSGLGNAVNPIASLAGRGMFGIPMILLIGWRGDPDHDDHVQHDLQGRITPTLCDDLEVPWKALDGEAGHVAEIVRWAKETAIREESPVALLVPKGVLLGEKTPFGGEFEYPLSREEAIEAILDVVPYGAMVSATTGRAARELFHLREKRGEGHECDYLNVGSMGHASSVAYGVALGNPEKQVICLDGDGAAIMHMGVLAAPPRDMVPNLLHVVLNNGMHESVGGQPTVGYRVDFTKIAEACGYATVGRAVSSRDEISSAVMGLFGATAAGFVDVRIHPGIRSDLPPLDVDPKNMKQEIADFMRELA